MSLAATASITFSGNTATVVATVTGSSGGSLTLEYLWDDGATTTHSTAAGVTMDSATHTYSVYDYDVPHPPGAYPELLTVIVVDGFTATQVSLSLPVPQPFLVITPNTGRAPLTATVAGSNSNPPPAGVTDTAFLFTSSDGWSYTAASAGTVSHTWTRRGNFLSSLRITNSLGWASSNGAHNIPVPVVLNTPRLRQYPRDDFLGGAPRQGRTAGSTSVQASTRQGWKATYR